ncbi:MAG: DivIVA domain-containing protein [Solirubrobacteraceae bacterium]
MSYFRKPGAGLDQQPDAGTERDELLHYESADQPPSPRAVLTEHLGRVSRWFQGLDVEPDDGATVEWDPLAELAPADAVTLPRAEPHRDEVAPRFPLGPFGYARADVDSALAELERQLAERDHELGQLRDQIKPPLSITEEIERIGEQTASILVVAHDQAHATASRAQEQAERCIADAAANAVAITEEATQRLRELDDETDSVWRERARLLEDTRTVSVRLAALVDEAETRFPADGERAMSDSTATR